jgi:NAD-dependent dihydropyrimidine dehydrogenase PreA subunit
MADNCAEGAIAVPVEPVMSDDSEAFQAFAACRSTPLPNPERPQLQTGEGPALIPCLHNLGLEALAELYRRGVRELVLAEAPCESCALGSAPRLATRVASFNCLLSPQSMDQVRIVELPPAEWRKRRDAAIDSARKTIGDALLLENGGEGPAPALPRIDAQLCTGCLACVSVCPHEVFALITHPSGRRELLVADGRRCTGCNLCSDACAAKCISIVRNSSRSSAGVAMSHATCRSCRADFRLPVAKADGRALCPNCRSVNHQTKEAQVIR